MINPESINKNQPILTNASSFGKQKLIRLRGPKPTFLKPIPLSDKEKTNLQRFGTSININRDKLLNCHLEISRFYLTDSSKDSTFAREKVAEHAIKLAVKTYPLYGSRQSFESIIRSSSVYTLYYLHREHLVRTNNGDYPYAKLEFLCKKTLQFDGLVRKWLYQNYSRPLMFQMKDQLMDNDPTLSHGDAEVVAKKRIAEIFEFLPFELFAFAAQKGATCETKRFYVSLPEFPKLSINTGDLQNLFDSVFVFRKESQNDQVPKRTLTFRDFARFFNIYVFHYGVTTNTYGYLVDCKYIAKQLNEYETAKFKAGLVDFSLNNPLVSERAKNLVRDHKNFMNSNKESKRARSKQGIRLGREESFY